MAGLGPSLNVCRERMALLIRMCCGTLGGSFNLFSQASSSYSEETESLTTPTVCMKNTVLKHVMSLGKDLAGS